MTGLTHLAKGSVLPMLCAFLATAGAAVVSAWWRNRRTTDRPGISGEPPAARHTWPIPAATVAGFLAVTAPLLWNSVRTFGNPFYDPNTKVYFWAESPDEMAALHEFDLAQQKPALDARLMREPLVREFLPKWAGDPARLERLRARVLAGESVPLEGEFNILPGFSQWWTRHSIGEAVSRTWRGLADVVGRNFIHRNGYGRHLAVWLGLAFIAGASALIARPREFTRAASGARFAIAFIVLNIGGNLLLYGWWAQVSDRNRFFLTQFLPILFSCGLLIRAGFQMLPGRWQLRIPWKSGARHIELTPWRVVVAALWIFTLWDVEDIDASRKQLPQ
jgi:hypothetical protein